LPERYADLEDALRQLANLGGEPAVRRVLTGSTAVCVRSWQLTECLQRLGVASRGAIEPARPGGTTTVLRAHGRFPSAAGQVEWIELSRQHDESIWPPPGRRAYRYGEHISARWPARTTGTLTASPARDASSSAVLPEAIDSELQMAAMCFQTARVSVDSRTALLPA
jgi:hypothetical protein